MLRPSAGEPIAVDPLPGAVIDEVFGDAEAGVALDVLDEILVAVAAVEHIEHEVEPLALVRDDLRHALIVLGLRDVEHGEHIRAERLLARVHDGHLLRQVDDAPHGLEVEAEQVEGPRLGLLVGAPLGHHPERIRERVEDPHQEALALVCRHGAPRVDRGAD
jgi:hypothetical protein